MGSLIQNACSIKTLRLCRKFFHTFDVSAKRAYRPHVPGDLNIGDVVRFRRLGGNIQVGQVRYIGHLPGKSEPFVGVETEYASETVVN